MAGTIRGWVGIAIPTAAGSQTQERTSTPGIYVSIYRFLKKLEAVGITTEIARSGGGSTTPRYPKLNHQWQPYPIESNAWSVFRFNTNAGRTWPWYFLVQCSIGSQSNFGSSPGNPGKIQNETSSYTYTIVACQSAIGVGGDQNPWNGTGTVLGDNSKGAAVWKIPAGGTDVLVLPRSNNAGGTHATAKENCSLIRQTDTNKRMEILHLWADNDSFMIGSMADGNTAMNVMYNGLYTPMPGMTVAYPFAQFLQVGVGSPTLGLKTGTDYGGGIVTGASEVRGIGIYWHDEQWYQPNRASTDYLNDILPMHLGSVGDYGKEGILGYVPLEMLGATSQLIPYTTDKTGTKIAFGSSGVGAHFVVPWSPDITLPRPVMDPTGYEFGFGG